MKLRKALLAIGMIVFAACANASRLTDDHVILRTFNFDLDTLKAKIVHDRFEVSWHAIIDVYPENENEDLRDYTPSESELHYSESIGYVQFMIDTYSYSVWIEGVGEDGPDRISRDDVMGLLERAYETTGLSKRPIIAEIGISDDGTDLAHGKLR